VAVSVTACTTLSRSRSDATAAPTSFNAAVTAAFSSSNRSRSASAFRVSVMSRAIFEAPMIVPAALRTGEIDREIINRRPSLVTRIVSKCSMRWPFRSRARMSSSSA
jgi:hypothetical protein